MPVDWTKVWAGRFPGASGGPSKGSGGGRSGSKTSGYAQLGRQRWVKDKKDATKEVLMERGTDGQWKPAVGPDGTTMSRLTGGTKGHVKQKIPELGDDKFAGYANEFEKRVTSRTKPIRERLHAAQRLAAIAQAATTNPLAYSGVGTAAALFMGESGRLTDEDVIRYIRNYKIENIVKQAFKTGTLGTWLEENKNHMNNLLSLMSAKEAAIYDKVVEYEADAFQSRTGIPAQTARGFIARRPESVAEFDKNFQDRYGHMVQSTETPDSALTSMFRSAGDKIGEAGDAMKDWLTPGKPKEEAPAQQAPTLQQAPPEPKAPQPSGLSPWIKQEQPAAPPVQQQMPPPQAAPPAPAQAPPAPAPAAAAPEPASEDQQALQWAQQNPDDPRAGEILKRNKR